MTIGGLLLMVAASAFGIHLLRPPAPPDEGQAILLAKAHLMAHDEFDYPGGYWTRTEWNPKRGSWRVAFQPAGPAKRGGYSMLIEVKGDRSCHSSPMDFLFFDLR